MIRIIFSYFRLLSLDVVLGACVSTLFVAKCLDTVLPTLVVVTLGIAVWIIYTADHLLDGSKSNEKPLTLRHQFHQKHRIVILIVLILMIFVGSILVIQLPEQIIINGIILVGCVAVYFLGLRIIGSRPAAYKEPLVALAYAMGVFLGPVSLSPNLDYQTIIFLFATYVLMAFANLLTFSIYELAVDEGDKHTSLVRYVGRKKAIYLINTCFIALLTLWSYQLSIASILNIHSTILLLMIVVLATVNYWKKFFETNEWYRIISDGVFYFPLIVLL